MSMREINMAITLSALEPRCALSWVQLASNQILQDPTGLTSGKCSGGTIVGGVWLCILSYLSLRPRV